MFAFGYVPKDWAACAGQVLPIEQNTELYSLIGTHTAATGNQHSGCPICGGA